jgi:hypothetical protein
MTLMPGSFNCVHDGFKKQESGCEIDPEEGTKCQAGNSKDLYAV